eukprot:365566-Chlamydomonas_euryale.AAC.12
MLLGRSRLVDGVLDLRRLQRCQVQGHTHRRAQVEITSVERQEWEKTCRPACVLGSWPLQRATYACAHTREGAAIKTAPPTGGSLWTKRAQRDSLAGCLSWQP